MSLYLYEVVCKFSAQSSNYFAMLKLVAYSISLSLLLFSLTYILLEINQDIDQVGEGVENPRHVIVYLVHSKHQKSLAMSLIGLFKNFNRRFRKTVVIFHESDFKAKLFLNDLMKFSFFTKNDFKLFKFVEVSFHLSPKFIAKHGQNSTNFVPVFHHVFPGYHHVLNFWFQQVFSIPAMREVTYFWRLDSDSQLTVAVNYDIFTFMEDNGYIYGYRSQEYDSPLVTRGLLEFVDKFKSSNNNTTLKQYRNSQTRNEIDMPVPIFYNNFEIVHVPTFQYHEGIKAFNNAVEDSLKIYENRWGDAPLRYFQITLFFNKTKYCHHFCDISYFHQKHFKPNCN